MQKKFVHLFSLSSRFFFYCPEFFFGDTFLLFLPNILLSSLLQKNTRAKTAIRKSVAILLLPLWKGQKNESNTRINIGNAVMLLLFGKMIWEKDDDDVDDDKGCDGEKSGLVLVGFLYIYSHFFTSCMTGKRRSKDYGLAIRNRLPISTKNWSYLKAVPRL